MKIMSGKLIQVALVLIMVLILFPIFVKAEDHHHHKSPHAHTFTPLEEEDFFQSTFKYLSSKANFPITTWNECRDRTIEGNYIGYRCSRKRTISKVLFSYLKTHFISCVREAAFANGDTDIKDISIEHKGIFADSRHSPDSLHGQGRAIDIKSISYKLSFFRKVTMNHESDGHGAFYTTLRECWGEKIKRNNNCPLFEDDPYLTGSIGKDDEDHQIHMHLSVPVCSNSEYLEPYKRR